MIDTITPTTPLSDLVHHDAAIANWWDEPDKRSELELPGRVIASLGAAGIHTVEQLKAAGPHRLRMLEGIGKLGFSQIVNLLRCLDRQNGGGSQTKPVDVAEIKDGVAYDKQGRSVGLVGRQGPS
jgi:hypothetical protein